MPIAVTVVHDEVPVVVQVDDELLEFAEEFGLFGAGLSFQIPAEAFQSAQRWIGAAVPQVPLGAMQRLDQGRVARAVAVCRAALDHLFEVLYPHGDVEPIENVLTAVTKAELRKPYGIASIRQKGHRLTRLHTFS